MSSNVFIVRFHNKSASIFDNRISNQKEKTIYIRDGKKIIAKLNLEVCFHFSIEDFRSWFNVDTENIPDDIKRNLFIDFECNKIYIYVKNQDIFKQIDDYHCYDDKCFQFVIENSEISNKILNPNMVDINSTEGILYFVPKKSIVCELKQGELYCYSLFYDKSKFRMHFAYYDKNENTKKIEQL